MGDLNINLLNCESKPESNDFLHMLNSYFFLPYILQPTRITERFATLIDNTFANSYSMDAITGNLVLTISDHLPQFLIIDDIKVKYKILNYFRNDYSKFNEEKFINDFLYIDWNSNSDNELDTSAKFDFFYDKISHLVNVHVPFKKLFKHEIKLSTKPWIPKDILAKIRHWEKLYSRINKCKQPNPNLMALHKQFRNSVVKDIKASKADYFFLCNSNNIKNIWSGIRSIINTSKVKANFIPTLNENGKIYRQSLCYCKHFQQLH